MNRSGERVDGPFAHFPSPQVSRTPFSAGFLAQRSQLYRREPFHLPQHTAEWYFETAFLLTVAGPRWFHTSFPIKPLWAPKNIKRIT
jgi:hypothetical protein